MGKSEAVHIYKFGRDISDNACGVGATIKNESIGSNDERVTTDTETENDISHYNLGRDRQMTQIRQPVRYAQADINSFAFSVVDYIDEIEPKTFKYVLSSRDKHK